jgi:hypothetical protein
MRRKTTVNRHQCHALGTGVEVHRSRYELERILSGPGALREHWRSVVVAVRGNHSSESGSATIEPNLEADA